MGVSSNISLFLIISNSKFLKKKNTLEADMVFFFLMFRMFITSCKRLRIMKGSEAKGLGCAV